MLKIFEVFLLKTVLYNFDVPFRTKQLQPRAGKFNALYFVEHGTICSRNKRQQQNHFFVSGWICLKQATILNKKTTHKNYIWL